MKIYASTEFINISLKNTELKLLDIKIENSCLFDNNTGKIGIKEISKILITLSFTCCTGRGS